MKVIAAALCVLALNIGIALAAPSAKVGDPYQILEVGLTQTGTDQGAVNCDDGTSSATGDVAYFVTRGDPADPDHRVLIEAIVDGKVRSAMTFEVTEQYPSALYNITAAGVIRSIVPDPANAGVGPCDYLLTELASDGTK